MNLLCSSGRSQPEFTYEGFNVRVAGKFCRFWSKLPLVQRVITAGRRFFMFKYLSTNEPASVFSATRTFEFIYVETSTIFRAGNNSAENAAGSFRPLQLRGN